MINFLPLGILLACPTAAQPIKPSADQTIELVAALGEAGRAMDALRRIWARMQPIEAVSRTPRNDNGRPQFPLSPDALGSAPTGNREEYSRLLLEEARAVNLTHLLYQKYLDLTAHHYHIQPRPMSGPLLNISESERNSVTWTRRYFLKSRVTGGRLRTPAEMLEAPSFLHYKGSIVVLRESGFKYPGFSALCMHHECGHLELASAAGSPPADKISEEIQIRQATLPLLTRVFNLEPDDWLNQILDLEGLHALLEKRRSVLDRDPRLSPAEIDEIEGRVKNGLMALASILKNHGPDSSEAAAFRSSSELFFLKLLPPSAPSQLTKDWENATRRWADMSAEKRRRATNETAGRILENLRGAGLTQARDETKQEVQERQVEERRLWERDEPKRKAQREDEKKRIEDHWGGILRRRDAEWKYLKSLAQWACSDPDELDAQAQSSGVVATNVDPIYLGSHISWESGGPGSLSKCQKWVLKNIEHLLWKNQRVTTVEISTWGRAYHKENPGAAKRIAGALNLFAKSLAQLLAALCS